MIRIELRAAEEKLFETIKDEITKEVAEKQDNKDVAKKRDHKNDITKGVREKIDVSIELMIKEMEKLTISSEKNEEDHTFKVTI